MENRTEAPSSIPSINAPARIGISGFEQADEVAHMIAWLGKGDDFRTFLVGDIESELYSQTPGAQLLTITCNDKPETKTTLLREEPGHMAIVTGLSITFPITVIVAAANGAVWTLDIAHNYTATDVHLAREQRKLTMNFNIIAARS